MRRVPLSWALGACRSCLPQVEDQSLGGLCSCRAGSSRGPPLWFPLWAAVVVPRRAEAAVAVPVLAVSHLRRPISITSLSSLGQKPQP